jgi:hypothetical protein
MNGAQKFSLSLLISVVLFAVAAVLFYPGDSVIRYTGVLAHRIEALYSNRVEESVTQDLDSIVDTVRAYHSANIARFEAVFNLPEFANTFETNWAADQIAAIDSAIEELEADQSAFSFVRIIDSGGEDIHYSSLEADIDQSFGPTQIIFRKPSEAFADELFGREDLAYLSAGVEPQQVRDLAERRSDLFLDYRGNQFIYRIPISDEVGIRGSALVYVGTSSLRTALLAGFDIEVGEQVRVLDRSVVVNVPTSIAVQVRESLSSHIDSVLSSDRRYLLESAPGSEAEFSYNVFTQDAGYGSSVVYLVPSRALRLPQILVYTVLGAVLLTTFLVVFLLLNIRQDAVVILSDRVKRLQVNLLREYVNQRSDRDFSAWRAELEARGDEVAREIKRGLGRVRKSQVEEVDRLINAGWNEILDVLAARSERVAPGQLDLDRLQAVVGQLVASNVTQAVSQSATADRSAVERATSPGPAQVEGIESLHGELEEIGDLEEAEEPGEPVEVEEIDEEPLQVQTTAREDEPLGTPVEVEEIEEPGSTDLFEEIAEVEEIGEVEEVLEATAVAEGEGIQEAEPILEADELAEATPVDVDELPELVVTEELTPVESDETAPDAEQAPVAEEVVDAGAETEVQPAAGLEEEPEAAPSEAGEAETIAPVEELEELEELEEPDEVEITEEESPAAIKSPAERVATHILDEEAELEWMAQQQVRNLPEPTFGFPGEATAAVAELQKPKELIKSEEPSGTVEGPSEAVEEAQQVSAYVSAEATEAVPEFAAEAAPDHGALGRLETVRELSFSLSTGTNAFGRSPGPGWGRTPAFRRRLADQEMGMSNSLPPDDGNDSEPPELLEEIDAGEELEDLSVVDEFEEIEELESIDEVALEEEAIEPVEEVPSVELEVEPVGEEEDVEILAVAVDEDEDLDSGVLEEIEEVEEGETAEEPVLLGADEAESAADTAVVAGPPKTITFADLGKRITPDYEIRSVVDILGRFQISANILVDTEGLVEIDRDAYAETKPADQEIKDLVDSVVHGESAEETAGVEELFGGEPVEPLPELSGSDREERPVRPTGISAFRFSVRGFDYDAFLRGYKRNDSGVMKSLVRFTKRWEARVGILYIRTEKGLKAEYTLGISQECRSSMLITEDSDIYRNVLSQRLVLFVNAPLTRVNEFSARCSIDDLGQFEKALFVPVTITGQDSYALLGLPEETESMEEAFRTIVPKLEQT